MVLHAEDSWVDSETERHKLSEVFGYAHRNEDGDYETDTTSYEAVLQAHLDRLGSVDTRAKAVTAVALRTLIVRYGVRGAGDPASNPGLLRRRGGDVLRWRLLIETNFRERKRFRIEPAYPDAEVTIFLLILRFVDKVPLVLETLGAVGHVQEWAGTPHNEQATALFYLATLWFMRTLELDDVWRRANEAEALARRNGDVEEVQSASSRRADARGQQEKAVELYSRACHDLKRRLAGNRGESGRRECLCDGYGLAQLVRHRRGLDPPQHCRVVRGYLGKGRDGGTYKRVLACAREEPFLTIGLKQFVLVGGAPVYYDQVDIRGLADYEFQGKEVTCHIEFSYRGARATDIQFVDPELRREHARRTRAARVAADARASGAAGGAGGAARSPPQPRWGGHDPRFSRPRGRQSRGPGKGAGKT